MEYKSQFITEASVKEESILKTNKVLRNTYILLALTLIFAASIAYLSANLGVRPLGIGMTLIGFYGLLFLTNMTANSNLGIIAVFALTGFMGYTIGPILNIYVAHGLSDTITFALLGTALVFFVCSGYLITTKKDMSFLAGTISSLFVVLLLAMIGSFFLNLSAFHLAMSALFVVFSTMVILYQTSEIIHGGETNYIRATVTLFVSLYNIFVSLLRILGSRN